EDARDLALDDAGAIVLDGDEALPVAMPHLDADLGKYSRLLTGVERIVHRFLDRRDERLRRRVEPEQVPVLQEELGNGDLALPRRHLGRRGGSGSSNCRHRWSKLLTQPEDYRVDRHA